MTLQTPAAETGAASKVRESLHTLADQPGVVLAAIDDRGFRVPVPESWGIPQDRTVPTPAEWGTMLDLVLPDEAFAVVDCFNRACAQGRADVVVHTRRDPASPVVLTFDSSLDPGGLVVAVLTPARREDAAAAASVSVPEGEALRPLTGTLLRSPTAHVLEADDRACLLLGTTRQQIIDASSTAFLHPDDSGVAVSGWMEMLATGHRSRMRVRYRCMRPQGSVWVWMEIDSELVDAEDGTSQVLSQLRDISEEMAVLDELARRERLFRRLAEALPLGLLRADADGVVEYANERAGLLLGEDHHGTSLGSWLQHLVGADRLDVEEAVRALRDGGDDQVVEVEVAPHGAPVRRCQISVVGLANGEDDDGTLVLVQDVTEQARLRDELRAQATFDALTGCHNRASTIRSLDEVLAADAAGSVAVAFVDLDRFKPINDTYGHAAGDELLIQVAERLRHVVRGGDVVGRLGGDEFLLVLRNVDDVEAAAIGERVAKALCGDVQLSTALVWLSASTGIVRSTVEDTAASLVARADAAMYAAKQNAHVARA